jgi:hypothetical protein
MDELQRTLNRWLALPSEEGSEQGPVVSGEAP